MSNSEYVFIKSYFIILFPIINSAKPLDDFFVWTDALENSNLLR